MSPEVAKAMAERVRDIVGADMGISATGIAGPDTDGVHKVGQVYVALAVNGETFVKELNLGEHRTRAYIRRAAGNYVYDMMRRYMTGLDVTGLRSK